MYFTCIMNILNPVASYSCFFPKQVYLWGSILEKNRLDALVGALGLVGRGFGCAGRAAWGWAWCWALWAGLGVDLAVLGALRGVGRGVGRAGLGWAWIWLCWARCVGLGVVLGALGWVGRGVWPCWARWAGLGVGFGRVERAGLGWAWGLAVLVLGVEFGSAGRTGLGWAWEWAWHGLRTWQCYVKIYGMFLRCCAACARFGLGFGRAGRAGLGLTRRSKASLKLCFKKEEIINTRKYVSKTLMWKRFAKQTRRKLKKLM